MDIQIKDKNCIITPYSPVLNQCQIIRILDVINEYKDFVIGINLENVSDCTFDFYEMINKIRDLCLYNIPSDIFVLLNNMRLDKIVKIYNTKNDFISDKNRLLNRNLKLVKY